MMICPLCGEEAYGERRSRFNDATEMDEWAHLTSHLRDSCTCWGKAECPCCGVMFSFLFGTTNRKQDRWDVHLGSIGIEAIKGRIVMRTLKQL